MFERIRRQSRDAFRYSEKLVKSIVYDPKNVGTNTVPKNAGVYLWRSKRNGEIVYVGRALGRKGLYQRIVRQHLSEGYAKSVFRRRVAEEYGLNLRGEAASFIRENFVFSFIPLEDRKIVSLVEIFLINEYSPKYNRAY